jgi:hypothetical protein
MWSYIRETLQEGSGKSDHSCLNPLLASATQRARRTLLVSDPPVGTAEHQNRNQLLENCPVGYARSVAAKWIVGFPLRKESGELLPYGLDDVRLECGHGDRLLHIGKLGQLPG